MTDKYSLINVCKTIKLDYKDTTYNNDNTNLSFPEKIQTMNLIFTFKITISLLSFAKLASSDKNTTSLNF